MTDMAVPPRHIIRSIVFDLDGGSAVMEFINPRTDVRDNGLIIQHAIEIPPTQDLLPHLDRLMSAAVAALRAALDEMAETEPIPLPGEAYDDDEDDDEPSPYDNPNERPL